MNNADSNYTLSTLGFLHSLVWIMSTMQMQPSAMSNRQEHRIFRCNGMTRKIKYIYVPRCQATTYSPELSYYL